MSLKRTRALGCIIGLSSSQPCGSSKGLLLEDDEDDDCCSRRLIDGNEEPEGKSYNLHPYFGEESLQPLNDTTTIKVEKPVGAMAVAAAPPPGGTLSPGTASEMTFVSDSSSGTWPVSEMVHSCLRLPDLELEQSSISSNSGISKSSTLTPSSLKSASLSVPNSPRSTTVYSALTTTTTTPGATSITSLNNNSFHSFSGSGSVHSAPTTPTRKNRLPLTSPLPRRSPSNALVSHRKAHSTSNLLVPMTTLQPPPCKQVEETLKLLKSIKQQIKALKRRESHLSTKLQVQRRERQQMQEQIATMESRRLRLEALFVRPLPLVLLLPVLASSTTSKSSLEDEYDLCLVSEGQDSWNALPPMIRIQLVPGSFLHQGVALSSGTGAILLHFGPTLTQPMAASITFLRQDPMDLPHLDLQALCKQMDFPFWQRTTCGQVLEPDSKQLGEASCKFLFDALTDHKRMWRDHLSHVVDKKTSRIQWIATNEADSLYYQAIPSSAAAAGSTALVELD